MPNSITGKTVVIYGGTGGIGSAFAEELVSTEKPGKLVIISKNKEKNEKFVSELQAKADKDTKVIGYAYDVSSYSDETFHGGLKSLGIDKINHLVFTLITGSVMIKALKDVTQQDIDEKYGYLKSIFSIIAGLIREDFMDQDYQNSITMTSGSVVRRPNKNFAILASVAGGQVSLCKGLATDLAPLRVNIILPGYVDTPLHGPAREQYNQIMEQILPLKHAGKPEELVPVYMACLKSTYMTGAEIVIEGGALLSSN